MSYQIEDVPPEIDADELRERRLEEGLSRSELSGRIGSCKSSIMRWENGDRQPSIAHRRALREELGL